MESTPRATMPLPTAPAAQSPAPPTTTQSVERPSSFGGLGRELAGHFFRFVALGQQVDVEFQRGEQFFDQVRLATSSSNMPLASLTSVANSPVRRRRISSFGSSTLRVFSKCLRLVVPQPEDFRGGEAGQGRIGDQLDEIRPAADPLFDFGALGGGPLVVPEDRPADDLVVLVEKHRAVHLAGEPDRLHVGRLELGLGHRLADRARSWPATSRPGLARSRAAWGGSRDRFPWPRPGSCPSSSMARVFVPEVPMSMPR